MPTLHCAPGACSLSVHIVLEWIGKPYDLVKVNCLDPEHKKINSASAVLALDYGGEQPLTQCAAVLADPAVHRAMLADGLAKKRH